ncbi:RNA methyltransferase [Priestia aryabhattai]|uniref:TrmH family RNA methyltransferase n=1 Tax=Priestia aryabhattai TaxID=412384 RepID=UPI002E1F6550|nr:RNA methyltransferase [Priestia aryabhattai]
MFVKQIDSVKNPQVKAWKKLHNKKDRDKQGLFMVEGFHLVEEAIKNNDCVKELIIRESTEVPAQWNIDGIEITVVNEAIIKLLSDTETPQGIIAVCVQTKHAEIIHTAQKVLLLDAVQDPGNLGTIIRTADAAGVEAIIIGEGSVDVYNPKVVRSTQGAIFHLPIVKGDLLEIISLLKERGIAVYGTSLQNGKVYTHVKPSNEFALIVGNEGNGVSEKVLEQTDQNLYIPIYGKSESLNVAIASGILLYYLRGM